MSSTVRDDFIHVTDEPNPKQSHRRWGGVDAPRFEIVMALEFLPTVAMGGWS
jgi:hypothetical protein